MQFHEFKSYMENIEKSLEMQDKYAEIMSVEFLDDMAGYLIDSMIELLENELNTDLISWFVFDTNFGKWNCGVKENEYMFRIKTIEELWKVIHLMNI